MHFYLDLMDFTVIWLTILIKSKTFSECIANLLKNLKPKNCSLPWEYPDDDRSAEKPCVEKDDYVRNSNAYFFNAGKIIRGQVTDCLSKHFTRIKTKNHT